MLITRVMVFHLKATPVYGVAFIVLGLTLGFTWLSIFDAILSSELQLREGTVRWKSWKETPIPMYIDVYFFNWTNPMRIKHEKPHFSEIGPYRFHEKRWKVDVQWNENGTVSYRQVRRWEFDPEASSGTLSDQIATVNVVALTTAYSTRFQNYFDQAAVSFTMVTLRQRIEVTKTVNELLFEGYKDNLLTIADHLPDSLKNGARTSDRFGWFYQRNGSSEMDGKYNMATDIESIGKVWQWNFRNKTEFLGSGCPTPITGNSGEMWPPKIEKMSTLSIFSPDFCRTVKLEYQGEDEIEGIDGYLFSGSSNMFTESGYCSPDSPHGMLNLTACRWGAPLFISYPHFLHADPKVQNAVEGLSPDPDKHSFDMLIEPNLGIPLSVKGRFQVNMLLQRLDGYRIFKDIPSQVYIPVMWIDTRAYITSAEALKIWVIQIAPSCGIIFAVALIVIGLSLIIFDRRHRKCREPPKPVIVIKV